MDARNMNGYAKHLTAAAMDARNMNGYAKHLTAAASEAGGDGDVLVAKRRPEADGEIGVGKRAKAEGEGAGAWSKANGVAAVVGVKTAAEDEGEGAGAWNKANGVAAVIGVKTAAEDEGEAKQAVTKGKKLVKLDGAYIELMMELLAPTPYRVFPEEVINMSEYPEEREYLRAAQAKRLAFLKKCEDFHEGIYEQYRNKGYAIIEESESDDDDESIALKY